MRKQFTKPLLALLVLFIINFLTACYASDVCPPPISYYLRDVKIKAVDRIIEPDGTMQSFYSDTIKHNLGFEILTEVEIADVFPRKQIAPLMNVAYGNCNDEVILNQIDPFSTKMYANKPFHCNNVEIPAFENLLMRSELLTAFEFPSSLTLNTDAVIIVHTEQLEFLKEEYTFYFEWMTNDNTLLMDSVSVYLDF